MLAQRACPRRTFLLACAKRHDHLAFVRDVLLDKGPSGFKFEPGYAPTRPHRRTGIAQSYQQVKEALAQFWLRDVRGKEWCDGLGVVWMSTRTRRCLRLGSGVDPLTGAMYAYRHRWIFHQCIIGDNV